MLASPLEECKKHQEGLSILSSKFILDFSPVGYQVKHNSLDEFVKGKQINWQLVKGRDCVLNFFVISNANLAQCLVDSCSLTNN